MIPSSLEGWLVRGRILPVVDLRCREGELAARALAFAATATAAQADTVISIRHGDCLHDALASLDPSWVLKDGFLATTAPGSRLVLASDAPTADDDAVDDAWRRIEHRRPLLWDLMVGPAARSPLLLLGCDPLSGSLRDLVARLRPAGSFDPTGWLVAEGVDDRTSSTWQELGIEVIDATDEAAVGALRTVLRRGTAATPSVEAPDPSGTTDSPFKLLDYYEVGDANRFHGRATETARLFDLVAANRLVVATGASGTGKTSLLNAGLLARVQRTPPFQGVYVRCLEDPMKQIVSALSQLVGAELPPWSYDRSSRRTELWAIVDRAPVLPVIVLDQAEELFTRFEKNLRNGVLSLIAEAVVEPRCRARFVLGIRDDFLAHLTVFRDELPDILQTCFYVAPLSFDNAVEALEKPFARAGVRIEDGLAAEIISDLGIGATISPQVQIVGDHLFRARQASTVGREDYEAAGGSRGILSSFLRSEIDKSGRDAQEIEQVLKAMVTSEGTKDVLSLDDIAGRARLDPADIQRILTGLVSASRLVRPVTDDVDRYELSHEYLTLEIWRWLTPEEREVREVEEMISQDLRAWTHVQELRLGVERLDAYYGLASHLTIDEDLATLLLLSSVRHARPHDRWVAAIAELGPSARHRISEQLLAYVATASDGTRFEAAEAVAELDDKALVAALGSADRNVCLGALYMVGGLGVTAARDALLDIALAGHDVELCCVACLALGEIGDTIATAALRALAEDEDQSNAIVAAAIEGLGIRCSSEVYDVIWRALVSADPLRHRAAGRAIAAATAPSQLLQHLAGRAAELREGGEQSSTDDRTLLYRILHGLDAKRSGSERLLDPLRSWIDVVGFLPRGFESGWLVKALKKDDKPPQQVATIRFGRGRITVEDVVDALGDSNESAVCSALVETKVDVYPLLRTLSSNPDHRLRAVALMALGKRQAENAGEWKAYIRPSLLEQAFRDSSSDVRYWACIASAQLGLDVCVQFIRGLIRDDERSIGWCQSDAGPRVSDAAGWALDRLRPESSVWRKGWQLDRDAAQESRLVGR